MALFGFVCSDAGVASVSGVTVPAGTFNGTTNKVAGLANSSFSNWGGTYGPKVRNADNPTGTGVLIITPSTTDAVVRVYAFDTTTVLTRLWQVPDATGAPIVPVGTTYGTINSVKAACGAAGVIYFDVNGMAVA